METPKDSCPVCLEDGEEEKLSLLKPCGHAIHKKCMLHWTEKGSNLCPVCRTKSESFQDGEKIKKVRKNEEIYEEYNRGYFPRNSHVNSRANRSEYPYGRAETPYTYRSVDHTRRLRQSASVEWYRVPHEMGRRDWRDNFIVQTRQNRSNSADPDRDRSNREFRMWCMRFNISIGLSFIVSEEDVDFRILRQVFFHTGDPVMLKENIYLLLKEFNKKFKDWGCCLEKKTFKIRGAVQRQICNQFFFH